MYSRLINRLSATPFGSWIVRVFAAKVDPLIFRASNGRFTSTGKPTLPMLAVTAIGAKSGEPRTVQLAYHRDGADFLVVASAMGQERHPAWSYNLIANPEVELQLRGERVAAVAEVLSSAEKEGLWGEIASTIPQMHTYRRRTDRDIKVFRLVVR